MDRCTGCGGPWPDGEGWKPHAEGCPEALGDAEAIRRADRKLRHELEAIEDPQLRKECLDAF